MAIVSEEEQSKRAVGTISVLAKLIAAIPVFGDLMMAYMYFLHIGQILSRSAERIKDLIILQLFGAMFFASWGVLFFSIYALDFLDPPTFFYWIVFAVYRVLIQTKWFSYIDTRLELRVGNI